MITAKKSPEVLEYLLGRRSASVKAMGGPGPRPDEIQTILQAASRVPDHGKTVPFYFVVFEGKAREEVGDIIAKLAPPEKAGEEAKRFLRAPVVIGVISRARPAKHPRWEQILTAGAVCQNMLLAASSLGYGAQWLTEWYSYEERFRAAMGFDERDTIAGFIHIGTPTEMPLERERPDLAHIVTHWQSGAVLNKGDYYDQDKFGMPKAGVKVYETRRIKRKRNKWNIPEWLEKEVIARDTSCIYCQKNFLIPPFSKGEEPSWEHIINDARIITPENIALCCVSCNASKGAKNLKDWLLSDYCLQRGINSDSIASVAQKILSKN